MDLVLFIAIADEPSDDDDRRLRKRVGVVAGYLTIVAPLTLPIQAQGHPLSWLLAIGLSVFSVGNLILLARSRAFDRYVIALSPVTSPVMHISRRWAPGRPLMTTGRINAAAAAKAA